MTTWSACVRALEALRVGTEGGGSTWTISPSGPISKRKVEELRWMTGWRIPSPSWTVSCGAWDEYRCGAAIGAGSLFQFLSLSLFSLVMVAISVSTGIIRTPPPYWLVNAGSYDYRKKKKKKKLRTSNQPQRVGSCLGTTPLKGVMSPDSVGHR